MPPTPFALGATPSILVTPDGAVHVRVHATTLHLSGAEFIELVGKALEALAVVTRLAHKARAGGPAGSGGEVH